MGMSLLLLLDSDILIDIQRGHAPAVAWLNSLADTPSISGMAAMELLQAAANKQQLRAAQRLGQLFPLLGQRKAIAMWH